MRTILELEKLSLVELRAIAKDHDIPRANRLKKERLVLSIRQAEAGKEGLEIRGGILEIMSEGIGFLRADNYRVSSKDIYVSQAQLRKFNLRNGDMVVGFVREPRQSERHYGLTKV